MTFQGTTSLKSLMESETRGSCVLALPRVSPPQVPQPLEPSQTAAGAWQTPPNPSAGVKESRWFEKNLSSLGSVAGLWIAIKGNQLRASSDDLEEILDWLTAERIVDALVVQVPEDLTADRYMLA